MTIRQIFFLSLSSPPQRYFLYNFTKQFSHSTHSIVKVSNKDPFNDSDWLINSMTQNSRDWLVSLPVISRLTFKQFVKVKLNFVPLLQTSTRHYERFPYQSISLIPHSCLFVLHCLPTLTRGVEICRCAKEAIRLKRLAD